MSNPFASTANTAGEKIGGESDRLGGFRVYDTDVYEATIKNAYAGKSDGGAANMTFEVEMADGSKYSWVEWVTSGNEKGNLPYYINKQSGEKEYLPGFNRFNAIALMTAGKEPAALVFEEKHVKIYSYAAKAEVPTPVQVAVELLGKKILLGIEKHKVNKQVKSGKQLPNGKDEYVDGPEAREVNEVSKVFHFETRRTLQEAIAKLDAGVFIDKWTEANKGKVKDKMKPVAGGATAGAPNASGGSDKPTASLFS
ncbi:single strand DNA binding protein [Pseudomonas phage Littlefix]|uniref:Single-stranded DNA-binding protein n=1 Tax=Pseudomonas phage Littlefix TaxID=2079289 RepID=A0A2K9VHQ8_9CAUD|nr:single strand DNA binding protein [Pseudomonas phage Littlefix]AUV61818.1 hypothetical protein PsPhLittlefix_gp03 [Pseudomonas phage Littlefix]